MNFKKYTSIENSYRESFIEKVRETLVYFNCTDTLFSLSEKVDGCNTSIITDGKSIITGKRSSALAADDKFYHFQDFAEGMKDKVFAVFEDVKKEEKNPVESIQIFGEFFGGSYKGYKTKLEKIQKGIDYTPDHEFYAFDILVNYEDGTSRYLNVDEYTELFFDHNIFYNKELFRGTLDECLAYSPIFISTIGPRLGYPELEDNFAEGVVIKPVKELTFANGERIIIKNKNPKFNEFEKEDKAPKVENSDTCKSLCESVKQYVTEARLHNVMSHIGELEMPKQMGILLKEYTADALEEFRKDYPDFDTLEQNEQKIVNKSLTNASVSLIRKKF